MDAFSWIKLLAVFLASIVIIYFIYHYTYENLTLKAQYKIAFIGFVSNFLDTIGIGSFAVIIAMRKLLKVMPDDMKLIGSMNIQAVITALAQMLIFLHFIHTDIWTLVIALVMIALGGLISGFIVMKIDKVVITRVMLGAFIITGVLLFLLQMNIVQFNNTSHAIGGVKLILFGIFMLIAGMLPAFGVGYYSLVKTSIFLFGVNPIIAFPIMAAASSYQMPVTSIAFIRQRHFYSKSTVLLAVFGVLGVFIAAPLISSMDGYTLKWLLLGVVIYNIITLMRSDATSKV